MGGWASPVYNNQYNYYIIYSLTLGRSLGVSFILWALILVAQWTVFRVGCIPASETTASNKTFIVSSGFKIWLWFPRGIFNPSVRCSLKNVNSWLKKPDFFSCIKILPKFPSQPRLS